MSKSRYFTAIGATVVAFVVSTILFNNVIDGYFEAYHLLASYMIGAAVGELFLGSNLPLAVGLRVASLSLSVLSGWLSLFEWGFFGFLGAIFVCLVPSITAILVILLVALALLLLLSAVMFPVHLIMCATRLY